MPCRGGAGPSGPLSWVAVISLSSLWEGQSQDSEVRPSSCSHSVAQSGSPGQFPKSRVLRAPSGPRVDADGVTPLSPHRLRFSAGFFRRRGHVHGRLAKSPPWLSPCHCLSGRIPLVALSWDLIVWKTHVGCGRRGPSPAVVDALVTKRGGWNPAVSPSPARRPPWSRPTN